MNRRTVFLDLNGTLVLPMKQETLADLYVIPVPPMRSSTLPLWFGRQPVRGPSRHQSDRIPPNQLKRALPAISTVDKLPPSSRRFAF